MSDSDTPHTPDGWNAASLGYADKVAPRLMRPFTDEMAERLEAEPNHDALEVGAGSGALTEALAPRVRSLLAGELEAAGFGAVEVDLVARDMEVSDFDECWEMFTIGAPPIQALLDRLGPESELRLKDSLRSIVENRYGGGPIRVSNAATVGAGVVVR